MTAKLDVTKSTALGWSATNSVRDYIAGIVAGDDEAQTTDGLPVAFRPVARSWDSSSATSRGADETERSRLLRAAARLAGKSRRALTEQIAAGLRPRRRGVLGTARGGAVPGDVGVRATAELVRRLEARGEIEDLGDRARRGGRGAVRRAADLDIANEPTVILVVGVNGTGKTTTIGKLAQKLREHGRAVLVGAADTFRAAAEEQLEMWAKRAGADFVGAPRGGDPAAVAFDAIEAARTRARHRARGHRRPAAHADQPDGRARQDPPRDRGPLEGAPHETLLVVDATTGQNGLQQARLFGESAGVTGVALTKLDGSAKGGVAVAIAYELGLPVKLVGVGEGLDDLRPFDPRDFARALVAG